MALRVYNTFTGRKEEFVTRDPGRVAMYVCGITPYDRAHVGHARSYVAFDVIRRYLERSGYQVKMIENITDIDDKIIARSQERNIDWRALVADQTEAFLKAMDSLGIQRADLYPMATEHIPGIIEMVAGLIEKGFAYEVEGDVYFEVRKFPGYGKLSKRKLDDQLPGARVAIDERLRDPRDFALWKSAKPGEPSWESPWGPGRPGWHIECSVMSLKHLGMDFDIHGGGSDLIFPHHEDEIAQSEAYTGESPLCRYWLHTGWLTLHKEKMSKSLGNFFTVEEVGAKFPLAVIRYFLVATHYRTQLEFSDASLTEAQSAFERIAILAKRVRDLLAAPAEAGESAPSPLREYSPATRQAFREAMDDDFNTPRALGALFTFVTQVNEIINTPGFVLTAGAQAELRDVQDCLTEVGDVLGLPLGPEAAPITAGPSAEAKAQLLADLRGLTAGKEQAAAALGEDLADDLDRLVRAAISLRRQARADKDWKIADGIRDLLASAGIVLEDFPEGTSWRLR